MQKGVKQNFEQAYLQIHVSDFAHLWTGGSTLHVSEAQRHLFAQRSTCKTSRSVSSSSINSSFSELWMASDTPFWSDLALLIAHVISVMGEDWWRVPMWWAKWRVSDSNSGGVWVQLVVRCSQGHMLWWCILEAAGRLWPARERKQGSEIKGHQEGKPSGVGSTVEVGWGEQLDCTCVLGVWLSWCGAKILLK